MPSRMMSVLTCVILASGCRQSEKSLQRQQQQYDVVQEGASGTVTSSLGEGTTTTATTVVSASTGTGVDTTTNFTLGNLTATGSTPPGSVGGTLPLTGSFAGAPPAQDRIRITRKAPREAAASSTVVTPEPETAPAGETGRHNNTATTSSTDHVSAPADPARPTENDRKRDRSSDAPAPEPPPPPPPTDTTGTQAARPPA